MIVRYIDYGRGKHRLDILGAMILKYYIHEGTCVIIIAPEELGELMDEYALNRERFYNSVRGGRGVVSGIDKEIAPEILKPLERLVEDGRVARVNLDDVRNLINRIFYCAEINMGRDNE